MFPEVFTSLPEVFTSLPEVPINVTSLPEVFTSLLQWFLGLSLLQLLGLGLLLFLSSILTVVVLLPNIYFRVMLYTDEVGIQLAGM